MLFATFQPLEINDEQNREKYAVFQEVLGYYPVFCFPARSVDEFAFGCFLSSPNFPERIILFEADNYDRFDAVKYNSMFGPTGTQGITEIMLKDCFVDVQEKYAEYVVPEITNVIQESDLYKFIFNTHIEDEYGFGQLFIETAGQQYDHMVASHKPSERAKKIFLKEAFTHFCARMWWCMALEETPLEKSYPFFPGVDDISNYNLYAKATLLRSKIFDDGQGDYSDYDEMYKNITTIIESVYESLYEKFYGRSGRNGPCGCGSGKKFKKCHMKYSVKLREGL